MITLDDVNEAIRELENAPKNYTTCQKLATFYILRDYMGEVLPAPGSFSGRNEDFAMSRIPVHGDSEFLQLIAGRPEAEVWSVMDELMGTIGVINPRLYDGVMRKIDRI